MKPVFLLSLLLSSLSSAQWERVPDVPGTRIVYSLLTAHDTLYVGTDSLVYVSTDAGTRWFAGVQPGASPDAIGCMLKQGNALFAGTFHNGIFRTTNDGLSWQSFSTGLSGLGAMDISNLLVRRDSLIAGTLGAGVFTTAADLHQPWSSWGDSIIDYQGDNVFRMLAVGNTVLAGAGANGYMFRYTDAQPWWNPIPMTSPRRIGETVLGMASGGTAVVAATASGIFRSTDEGLSWERTSVSIPPLTFAISPVYHGSTFFILMTTPLSSSLLMSSDEGRTWKLLGVYPVPNVFAVAIVGETFYLGGGEGLWRAPLSGLFTGVVERTTTPPAFRLQQNYPNPFNPSTRIPFSVESPGFVTLKVYDLLGREVQTLVNDNLQPGSYERTFDASHLAGGVYWYRLQSERYVETRSLLLLR